jgi:hypothetical protein
MGATIFGVCLSWRRSLPKGCEKASLAAKQSPSFFGNSRQVASRQELGEKIITHDITNRLIESVLPGPNASPTTVRRSHYFALRRRAVKLERFWW